MAHHCQSNLQQDVYTISRHHNCSFLTCLRLGVLEGTLDHRTPLAKGVGEAGQKASETSCSVLTEGCHTQVGRAPPQNNKAACGPDEAVNYQTYTKTDDQASETPSKPKHQPGIDVYVYTIPIDSCGIYLIRLLRT